MEENRTDYTEVPQVGKRRSSLGALNKSKPVTKLKSMFEAKGAAPKAKDASLLSKLKPISASHDAGSFAAALSGSMSALKMSISGPIGLPPTTPPEPLFAVLPGPAEPDAMPNPSPPRSVEEMRTSIPGYESLPDGSEADARSAKSPGSAGFLKRMSSSLKKALTPKSSGGKHKHGGFSPSYAGSEASNLSPRPSGQLLLTPSSQPSSTSLDLNCRSDQQQSAPLRSPSGLMGYDVHSARDDWVRSCDGSAEGAPRPIFSGSRPPRSPSVTPPASGPYLDGLTTQHEVSLQSTSRDVAPRLAPTASPDQSQIFKDVTTAGAPMVAEDSFISTDADGGVFSGPTHGAVPEDSFAESLTASPTVLEGSEVSRRSPPAREVNMGAALFSPPHPLSSEIAVVADAQVDDLVFPSLLSTDLPEAMVLVPDAAAPATAPLVAESLGAIAYTSADVDMAASEAMVPAEESLVAVLEIEQVAAASADTIAAAASMEVEGAARQETAFQQPSEIAGRPSFGVPASLDLDLAAAAKNSPGSPDAETPTAGGDTDSCIIGLTPVRPGTGALCEMNVDTPTLSTVAEGSPEASPAPSLMEYRAMDLGNEFSLAQSLHVLHEMDVEQAPCGANDAGGDEPLPCEQGDAAPQSDSGNSTVAPEESRAFESPAPPSPVQELTFFNEDIIAATSVVDVDMDCQDGVDRDLSAASMNSGALQLEGSSANDSDASAVAPTALETPPELMYEEPVATTAPEPAQAAEVATQLACVNDAEPVAGISTSPVHGGSVSAQQCPGADSAVCGNPGADSGASLEAIDQEPHPPPSDGICCASAVMADGFVGYQNLPMQPTHGATATTQAGQEFLASAVDPPADVCNASNDSSLSVELSTDAAVAIGPLPEASDPATVPEVEQPPVGHMATAPLVAISEGDEPTVAAAELAAPSVADPISVGLAPMAPSTEAEEDQHVFISGQRDEPSAVSNLLMAEQDVDMEDAGGITEDASNLSDQLPGAVLVQDDIIGLPGSPPIADAGPMVVPAAAAYNPEVLELQDDIASAAAGDAHPDDVSPQPAQAEVLLQATAIETSVTEAGEVVDESRITSCVASQCVSPHLGQHDLSTGAAKEPQQAGAGPHAMPFNLESSSSQGVLDVESAQQGEGAVDIPPDAPAPDRQAEEMAGTENTQSIIDEPPLPEPAVPTMESPASAVDPLSDLPAAVNDQPVDVDADLMEVDSSVAVAHLSIATAGALDTCVKGMTVEADTGACMLDHDSPPAEISLGQVEMQQQTSIPAVDPIDTCMAPTGVDGSTTAATAGGGTPMAVIPPTTDGAVPADLNAGATAADVHASLPSVSAPPAHPPGVDVPMADSLEAIEALWGNDDLLAEPGSATANMPMPQVASSPMSASSKQADSPVLPPSGRKVAPGVIFQVERESLDLFSLRNSCAARVSESLMVESLDTFEGMGICAKSRAVGFIPMASVKEGDEEAAVVGRTTGSEGGSGPASAGPQSPSVTFAVDTNGSPETLSTPGLDAAGSAVTTAIDTPSASKPVAALGMRGGAQALAAAANQAKAPGSALKAATPGGTARVTSTPSTALKAMAAANGAGSAAKAGVSKRLLPVVVPQARVPSTPGQPVAGPTGPVSVSRLPGLATTPGAAAARTVAPVMGAKPPVPALAISATPGAAPGRPGVTPRSGSVFASGKVHPPGSGIGRPGQQSAGRSGAGTALFDTPLILRAAAVPFADTPFSGCEFDLDTVDISAEASKAIAMLGGDAGKAVTGASAAASQHTTPALVAVRGAVPGTPTLSVLETHVQLLTNKLAEAEGNIHQLQDENAMLRDQLSTLQFESSMTNDLDMEREARQFLEQELAVVRHRSDGLEADLRAAHAEAKRREQAAAELFAVQQAKEADWARQKAETELQMQQMTSEVDEARRLAQQAGTRIAEAEARAAAATAKCDEETARSRELQVTLGLQAHQLVQVQRARDDAEAKFQRAMEQLISAQTSHKKAVVEYEQKILQSNNLVAQINDVRDKYRQMKQHAANCEQRVQHAEAKVQETAAALAAANMEKAELMQMCNELLTQLEATKVKGGR